MAHNKRGANANTIHFAIRIAVLKSMRVVGCGMRGRNGQPCEPARNRDPTHLGYLLCRSTT